MVLDKTKILNKYTKVKSKYKKNKTKKIRKWINNDVNVKLKKKHTIMVKKQKGGKGDSNNNDNITNVASGLFNTVSSAVSTVTSVLPQEASGKKQENDNTVKSNDNNQTNNKGNNQINDINKKKKNTNENTIIELIKQADMINPGDFRTYVGSNPFMSEKELVKQCK